MLTRILAAVGFFSALAASSPAGAQADFPRQIPYQGHLDLNGVPQNGAYHFRFELYSQESGGTALWSQEFTQVNVVDGEFSVTLGTESKNPLSDAVMQNEKLYLQISVNNTLLSGRQRILAVPYSMRNDTSGDYRIEGKLTVVGTGASGDGATINNGAIINGGAVINDGATINGDVSMPGDVVLQGRHDTIAYNGGAHTPTTTSWEIHAKKWEITIGSDYSARSYPIPHDLFLEYCADEDGCTVRVGMSYWHANAQNVQASVERILYYNADTGYYRINNVDGNAGVEDFDGQSPTGTSAMTQLTGPWNACFLLDYYCCPNEADSQQQLYLHWSQGGYNVSTKKCHLTIID